MLINAVLLSYYVSIKWGGETAGTLEQEGQVTGRGLTPIIKATLSSLESRIAVDPPASSTRPPSPGKTEYDAGLNAMVDDKLMQGLSAANALQDDRLVKRERALRAADMKLTRLTTDDGRVKVPSKQPEHQVSLPDFEWGNVNPVSGMQRVTCSDSLSDASGNDAFKGRFWGASAAGEPCAETACNKGEVYQVECPPGCLKQELGGAVFGLGSAKNPFMDLSSICRAAIVAQVSNDEETSIVAFKVVDPAKSYTGVSETGAQKLSTLDYRDAQPKYAGGSWYGMRAFVFVPASETIQVSNAAAPGGEGGHMALSKRKSMQLAESGDAKMSSLATLDGGQENMAIYFDGAEGTMLTFEGGGAMLAEAATSAITVEAWVYDSLLADRTGYVAFFQDQMGAAESGGDGIWAAEDGEEPLAEDEMDSGFVLGTDKGAFSFAIASEDTKRLDYLSMQACVSRTHVGEWVHVAGTYDGAVMKLYVNGVLSVEGYTQTGPIRWPTDAEAAELSMGAWLGRDEQRYYKGMMDEVRIWRAALTASQLSANMHQTLLMPTENLLMYWRFDRTYCEEVNFYQDKVSLSPGEEIDGEEDAISGVQRISSGAPVELMSVTWACLAECEPMAAPLHGTVSPEGVMHEGDTISVSCAAGYSLRCDDDSDACSTVTCQNDGDNNGIYLPDGAAECVGQCGAYPMVLNGEVLPSGPAHVDDVIDITCNDGYQLNDEANSPATCIDSGSGGRFDKTSAACVAVCDAYPPVEHGTASPDGPGVQGDEVTIICDEGYELVESVVSGSPATCIDGGAKYGGGVYDKPGAECRAKCLAYPPIEHGQVHLYSISMAQQHLLHSLLHSHRERFVYAHVHAHRPPKTTYLHVYV